MSVSSAQPIREVDRRGEPVHRNDERAAVEPAKVLNLAQAAALVRCSRAHLSNVVRAFQAAVHPARNALQLVLPETHTVH
jgi:hypothetical protein